MPRTSSTRLHVALAATLVLAMLPAAAAPGFTRSLVDVKWLEKNLGNPEVLILDASLAPGYAAQHIAGSINVDMLTYGAQDRPPEEMERLLQSWGVSPGKKIVLVDAGGTYLATRLFFALHYYGFPAESMAVLDGGLARWQAAGLPVTKEAPAPPAKGTFRIRKVEDDVRVRLPEVLEAAADPRAHALVEALTPEWHYGQVLMFGRPGHIPHSTLWPTADLFNEDKTFKSPAELGKMAGFLGIRPEQKVYTYCGGGVAASAPWFALRFLLGYPSVALFVESELGWLRDERELPYWTYDAPFLLRDSSWVQGWAGQMIRMYLDVPVSIIDVRPAAAWTEGHVPFSLNVPADVFRAHLARPGRLAEVLGTAGVDASHEAVVVSGAGVTKEAALAFAMLEKLGQKKVSLLTDSLEEWTKLGFKVTKEPTVVGPKKASRGDVSIPPTAYPANVREGVIVADASGGAGPYPRVFISSGAQPPARTADQKVVHVPYTELLQADGRPKAAKDVWSLLAKAGVPRYAELVCIAEDPAEAAVTYYVLRLMGFRDVKMAI